MENLDVAKELLQYHAYADEQLDKGRSEGYVLGQFRQLVFQVAEAIRAEARRA